VKPANFMLLICIALYIVVMSPVIVFMGLLFGVSPYYFWLSLVPLALLVLLWLVALGLTSGSRTKSSKDSKSAGEG